MNELNHKNKSTPHNFIGNIITTLFSCELTKQFVLLNVKTKEKEIKKKPKTLFYRTIENPHGNRSLTVDFAFVLVGQLNHNPPGFNIRGSNRKKTRFEGPKRSYLENVNSDEKNVVIIFPIILKNF